MCVSLMAGFMELMYYGENYSLLLNSILIYKAFKTKLWFDSRYVSRQLDGIGKQQLIMVFKIFINNMINNSIYPDVLGAMKIHCSRTHHSRGATNHIYHMFSCFF